MQSSMYLPQPWILATALLLAGFSTVPKAQDKTIANPALAEMIARSNALTDLSQAVPYELHARVTVEPGSSNAKQGEITIYRDHNRSRTELRLGDFHQVEVVDQNNRYVSRSRAYPLAGLNMLGMVEDAVQLSNRFPTVKFKNHSRTVGGTAASCFDGKLPSLKISFCFDQGTGAVLEMYDYSGLHGTFSGYAAAGEKLFPTKIELMQPGKPMHVAISEIQVTSRRFGNAKFAVPEGARAFPVCTGLTTTLTDAPGSGWVGSHTDIGEVYVYVVVEADGRLHDLTVYGAQHKWMEKDVSKLAHKWKFLPPECGARTIAAEIVLPLVRIAPMDSSGTDDSAPLPRPSWYVDPSNFDRPCCLSTDINNHPNTVTDH